MDARLFAIAPMGLRDRLSSPPLQRRFSYDPMLRMLFIDFRQLAIETRRDIERVKSEVEKRVRPLGHKVYAIIDYRGSMIDPAVFDSYCRMIDELETNCCLAVTRYGGGGPPNTHARAAATVRASQAAVQ